MEQVYKQESNENKQFWNIENYVSYWQLYVVIWKENMIEFSHFI